MRGGPQLTGRRAETLALLVVLLVGLAVRLPLAWVDLGITADMDVYFRWGQAMRTAGPGMVYSVSNTVSPPLLVALLGLAASVQPGGDHAGHLFTLVIKLSAMLADVLTACLIALHVRRRSARLAVVACGLYLLNPAVWYVSTIWGQTDALYTLFLVASMLALDRRRVAPAWICYALAFATKLQSVALAPVLLAYTYVVAGRGARGLRALAKGAAAGVAVFALVVLPWLSSGRFDSLLRVYTSSPEGRVDTSAYNLWYLLLLGNVHDASSSGYPPGLPLSYQALGLLLLVALSAAVAFLVSTGRMFLFVGAAALSLGIFALMTEMHERHLFPALAFLLLAAFHARNAALSGGGEKSEETTAAAHVSRPLLWAYGLLSVSYLFNLTTIAPFGPILGVNLVTVQSDTGYVLVLKAAAFIAAVFNLLLLAWLVAGRPSAPWRARPGSDAAVLRET